MTDAQKQAFLNLAKVVAYEDPIAKGRYATLFNSLYPVGKLKKINAVYKQSEILIASWPLNSIKKDLTVTATYEDGSSVVVPDECYTLKGTLVNGTSSIMVSYGGKSTFINVVSTRATSFLYSLKTSDFQRTSGINGTPPNYASSTNAKRISYTKFNIRLEGGKTYRFTALSSVGTAQMGIQVYNQKVLNAVSKNAEFVKSSDIYDPGWQVLDLTHTLPTNYNSSPIRGTRFTFRQSSANPDITDDFYIKQLTVEEVTS